jgi:transcriptional regulator with XRE-family HTH domain
MLNERLKNLRLAKGLTLQQVGDVFGISAASVSSWEKGKNQPDSRKLSELAKILGSSVEFLLNGSGGVNPGKSEFLFEPVGFIEWAAISKSLKVKSSKKSVMPLHSKLGSSGFATRYPGSQELIWTQERIPVEWHPKLSHFEENLHPNLSHPNRLSCLIFEQGWARSDQRGNFEQITQTCPSRQGLHPTS